MISRKHFFMLMTIGFVLSVFVTDVMDENLIKYSESKDGTLCYYNKDSIKRTSETVQVFDILKFNRKNEDWKSWVDLCINDSNQKSKQNCNRLSFVKNLNEINCKEGTYRIIVIVLYNEKSKILDMSSLKTSMTNIVPNTIIEELKNRVCK
ncbi:MAG: surface-adhesin E family protein [Syntrophales bacterium]